MRRLSFVSAALIFTCFVGVQPSLAQGNPPAGASIGEKVAEQPKAERSSRRTRAARKDREPTVGQMAARERQRKCGAEWKEAKAANRTGAMKWPQFWSRCNARLKGGQA
ncbi:hypothetical protein [Enterovirga aerilata]|uniref:Uncharacterized protein n=1 Tax=Enterovirga aerilata TaxID=2730920 RepID=A0A849I1T2_9HYPH|nr:hypothetical protein [Enterovirga sp. DB1703]NNM73322.1 hypothetical protein [Enterovirga sp. DB1703]